MSSWLIPSHDTKKKLINESNMLMNLMIQIYDCHFILQLQCGVLQLQAMISGQRKDMSR